jgi:UDP-N-acetylmuramoyl-tripeptide--D-alanyl-D-alanine ligase
MSWLTTAEIAALAQGELVGADVPVDGVSTDSRRCEVHQLFIALHGDRFDAHDFIDGGLQAAAVLVARRVETDLPQIVVDDTRLGLGRLAAGWRSRLHMPVIALTGSNGKTTVKEMIGAILATRGQVLVTAGNLNNDIGMPLTLLEARPFHDYVVLEMGANHFGEIAYLTRIARPDVALITNAGPAHLEGFGDVAGVARAKGEIFQGLTRDGVAVINADDAYAEQWLAQNRGRRIVRFGLTRPADVHAAWAGDGMPLHIETVQGGCEVRLPLPGRHNAMNALAASAATLAVDATIENVRTGLSGLTSVHGRLEVLAGPGGLRLIDDSYNANPASVQAAIQYLAALSGPRTLALGDMAELGDAGEQLHQRVGQTARESGIERLYAVGPLSRHAVEAFGSGARHFDDIRQLIEALQVELAPGEALLVKGSRSMRMEQVVEALLGRTKETHQGRNHAA